MIRRIIKVLVKSEVDESTNVNAEAFTTPAAILASASPLLRWRLEQYPNYPYMFITAKPRVFELLRRYMTVQYYSFKGIVDNNADYIEDCFEVMTLAHDLGFTRSVGDYYAKRLVGRRTALWSQEQKRNIDREILEKADKIPGGHTYCEALHRAYWASFPGSQAYGLDWDRTVPTGIQSKYPIILD